MPYIFCISRNKKYKFSLVEISRWPLELRLFSLWGTQWTSAYNWNVLLGWKLRKVYPTRCTWRGNKRLIKLRAVSKCIKIFYLLDHYSFLQLSRLSLIWKYMMFHLKKVCIFLNICVWDILRPANYIVVFRGFPLSQRKYLVDNPITLHYTQPSKYYQNFVVI
jgi:hypothetical protein